MKKPEKLKAAFANGSIPTAGDFADLIDAFVTREALTDADVAELGKLLTWWRSVNLGGTDVVLPGRLQAPGAADAGPAPAATPAPAIAIAVAIILVPADGEWHNLAPTNEHAGSWTCTVATIDARPGFQVSGTAVARCGAGAPGLAQIMEHEGLFFWRTLQFAWKDRAAGGAQLALRSRHDFGLDGKGTPARIGVRIDYRAN